MKKTTILMILVIALIAFSVSAGVAEGKGVFAELIDHGLDGSRLAELENMAEPLSVSVTTDSGITAEICQGLYEGNRVYISYRLSGNVSSSELHEGVPEGVNRWDRTEENTVAAEMFSSDDPEDQKMLEWLDGNGQRWAVVTGGSLSDGIDLEDDAYADIIDGEEVYLEDGTILGWKECVIPEENIADTLTFRLSLQSYSTVFFQDGTTLKRAYGDDETTDIEFTLSRKNRFETLLGSFQADAYQVQAELMQGTIDLKGTVRLLSPEMTKKWENWDEEDGADFIIGWVLYQDDRLVSDEGTVSISTEEDTLVFELVFPRLDSLEGLKLVPEYADSGERPGEAVTFTPAAQ